ncbi:twin-arginine translocase subunit TatC [Homoserinibacter sp. GY 40078]|uniref:twin-arginine translocase subunit TatC n=1 Tax=Homoserinibacter sp. GY 40078 TaxID=2603275 RepID=UPI0011CA1484|nr:twin-arginine translocase subunit TatC [Homoserinibacter sp. GY 40078]TXK17637.1 twin-arginine translocase subunit TatC [Homoserinibacter sp. GY 40078]
MSLAEHLIELRRRLTRAGLAIAAGTVVGWLLYDLAWLGELLEPLVPGAQAALDGKGTWSAISGPVFDIATAGGADPDRIAINFTNITGAFDVRLQVSLVTGIIISSPVWLFQLFAFFVPGLTRRERGYIFGFFFTAVPLFFAGCAAGWFVLPRIVEIMYSFVPDNATTLYEARVYLDFVLKLLLATGVAFVLPVFLVLLNFAGVLPGITILKSWRWAVIAIAVFTAIATPAGDIISMFLLALPMVLLYFAAVGVSVWHDRIVLARANAPQAGVSGA